MAEIKTREEKIEELVESIDNWDLDALIQWAKEVRRDILGDETNERIDSIYKIEIEGA